MKFGEKLRVLRKKLKKTQDEVALDLEISVRTYKNYELGQTYPKKREIYYKLADYFNVNVNYLFTEDEAFLADVGEKYGPASISQAEQIIEEVSSLFAGGTLKEDERDYVMRAIQEIYWDAKRVNKKYGKTQDDN